MSDITNKVIKLLKLSKNNSNVNEAACAYAQAQRLITKHNLDTALLHESESTDIYKKCILFSGKRKSAWKTRIAVACSNANNCFIWITRDARSYACMIAGSESDTEICKYIFDSILNQIEKLCKDYMLVQNMKRKGAKTIANSFKIGAAVTVEKSLVKAKQEVEQEYKGTTALIVVRNKLSKVEKWIRSQNDLVTKKAASSKINGMAYAQGLQAGSNVKLNKAIG